MSARGGRKSLHSAAYTLLLELLREERQRAGVSQEELSGRLDRARTFVTKCEAGERRVDLLEWLEIMAALDADPVAFLGRLAAAGVLRHPLHLGARCRRGAASKQGTDGSTIGAAVVPPAALPDEGTTRVVRKRRSPGRSG